MHVKNGKPMGLEFPIESVELTLTQTRQKVENAVLCRPYLEVNDTSLWLDIHHVARFFVLDGKSIAIQPYENADKDSIELFLNGSILGALLHQRGIIPFHGCSFSLNGKGILVCGKSGAGKSSVTASFCQNGAAFISDDITPVTIENGTVKTISLKTSMKLWNDSIEKLQVKNDNLKKIRPGMEKYYLPFPESNLEHKLDHILVLGIHNQDTFQARKLQNFEKYNLLRQQVYRKIYLKGMPQTEKNYFSQLVQIASAIQVTTILRPRNCDISELMHFIRKEIEL